MSIPNNNPFIFISKMLFLTFEEPRFSFSLDQISDIGFIVEDS